MKQMVASALLVVLFGGCQRSQYHEAVFVWAGASAEELDEVVARPLASRPDLGVVRTVAEEGRLRVFIHTSRPVAEIEQDLSDLGELTFLLSLDSVTHLPNGLPPLPEIADEPRPVVKLKDTSRHLGIQVTEVAAAVNSIEAKDVPAIEHKTLETSSGETVRLGDLAEVTLEWHPSHIVRSYVDGLELTDEREPE